VNPALPALGAITILSARAHAESLNHDESQITGWLYAPEVSNLNPKSLPIRR
jgi:hypothetical protein